MSLGFMNAVNMLMGLGITPERGETSARKQKIKDISTKINMIKSGRITRVLSEFVVEPVIICSNSTKDIDVIDKIIALNTDIFATFYSQVFQILNEFYRVDPREIIDIMGTSSSTLVDPFTRQGYIGEGGLAYENYDYLHDLFSDKPFISLEATTSTTSSPSVTSPSVSQPTSTNTNIPPNSPLNNMPNLPPHVKQQGQQLLDDIDNAEKLYNKRPQSYNVNMAVSRTQEKIDEQPLHKMHVRNLEITLKIYRGDDSEHATVKIPMVVRSHVLFVKLEEILSLLKPNSNEKSWIFRWYSYRAGAIRLSDLLFASDLIKEYRETKKQDKSKILDITHTRAINSLGTIVDPNRIRGFEANYNIIVIDQHDKKQIDSFMRGDILKNKKDAVLDQGHSIVLNVLDTDYERIDLIVRDMLGKTSMSFKQIKNKKSSSDELGELLKSLLTGKTMGIM